MQDLKHFTVYASGLCELASRRIVSIICRICSVIVCPLVAVVPLSCSAHSAKLRALNMIVMVFISGLISSCLLAFTLTANPNSFSRTSIRGFPRTRSLIDSNLEIRLYLHMNYTITSYNMTAGIQNENRVS